VTGTAVTGDASVADSTMSLTRPDGVLELVGSRARAFSSAPSPRPVTAAQIG